MRDSIQIGNFTLSEKIKAEPTINGKIQPYYGYWINRLDGEGMLVRAEKMEKLIEDYYEENF